MFTKHKKALIIIISILFFFAFIYRYPHKASQYDKAFGSSENYYWNLTGLYYRKYASCGIWSCTPDLFPWTRDQYIFGVNPLTFKYIGHQKRNEYEVEEAFFTDGKHIIYNQEIVPNSDLENFHIFDGYALDTNNVYLKGSVLTKLDTPSFELLECNVWKDKNGIYTAWGNMQHPIKDIDVASFEQVTDSCSTETEYNFKDKYSYYKADPINGFRKVRSVEVGNY